MLRSALLLTPFFFLGCAAPHTNPEIAGDAALAWSEATPAVEAHDSPAVSEVFTDLEQYPPPPPQGAPPPPRPRERFTLKGGYYGASEDEIDDGFIVLGSWLRPISPGFSSEVEIGYLDADGTDKGVDRDLWAIPLLAGGRFSVPIGQRLEFYLGIGLGTFYFDAEAKALGVSADADGFLFGGDGYFGADIQLGQSLYLGLEGKYFLTDSDSNLDGGLDGYVGLLTLGFAR
jgi:hypothetical protein